MSYIINTAGTELIAQTSEKLESGLVVQYAWRKAPEEIDATREANLVNAQHGKISNAKKWAAVERRLGFQVLAVKINQREFHLC